MDIILSASLTSIGFSLTLLSGTIFIYSSLLFVEYLIFLPMLIGGIGLLLYGVNDLTDRFALADKKLNLKSKSIHPLKKLLIKKFLS